MFTKTSFLLAAFLLPCYALPCDEFTSCASCISSGIGCIWCSTDLVANCQPVSSINCTAEDIVDPRSTNTANRLPLNGNNQLSLESVDMKLRVGEPQTVSLEVRAAPNFPLDFYLLMDLSISFSDDLQTVKSISAEIIEELENLTSASQLGMGTFIDKTIHPFIPERSLRIGYDNVGPMNESSACLDRICGEPVSYEHVVSLTNSTTLFQTSIQNLSVSRTADGPEGTLDAVMQAVVCKDIVGWREKSRKILMVMTDDYSHIAGDGAIAGIYRHNDAQCHTERREQDGKLLYTASADYDYPSVHQIRLVLQENEVVPVFAVRNNENNEFVFEYYKILVNEMRRGFVEEIQSNSTNLVSVIERAYNQIVSSTRVNFIRSTESNPAITFSVNAMCPEGSTGDGSSCIGIQNNIVKYNITVNLTSCSNEFTKESVTVSIPGFGRFDILIDGHCSCDCEDDVKLNSSVCLNNGNLSCGLCDCISCPIGLEGLECSGENRGKCFCGRCTCLPGFAGTECECSDSICQPSAQFPPCNNRGVCHCDGTCTCDVPTSTNIRPTSSQCLCSTDDCVSPDDGCRVHKNGSCIQCNGQGMCVCGSEGSFCRCNPSYSGRYCSVLSLIQECNTSPEIESCLVCFGNSQESNIDPEEECNCPDFKLGNPPSNVPVTNCSYFEPNSGCTYLYSFTVTSESTTIYYVMPTPNCLLLPPWAIGVVLLVALLIIGILILVAIKLLYVWLDYREVKQLRLEVQNSNFTTYQSPLYHDPNVTYRNVKYGKEE